MEEQLQEDWLDARLRDEAPYLDDAGFTLRVMQQLPPARAPRHSLRGAILLSAAVVSCLVVYLLAGDFLINSAAFLVAMPLSTVWAIAGASAFAVMVFGATAALARVRGQRL